MEEKILEMWEVFNFVFKENLANTFLQKWCNLQLREWQELQQQCFSVNGCLFCHCFFLANWDLLFHQDQIEWKEMKLLIRPCKLSFSEFPQCLEGSSYTDWRRCKDKRPRNSGTGLGILHAPSCSTHLQWGWHVWWQVQTPALTFPMCTTPLISYQCRPWVLLRLSHKSC